MQAPALSTISGHIRICPNSRSSGIERRRPLRSHGNDRLQNIRAGHHPLESAVFVVNEAHMHRRVAQDRDDIPCVDGLWYDRRVADQLANIRRLSR